MFVFFFRSRKNGTLWSLIIAKLILSRSVSSDEVKQHYRRKEGYFYFKYFYFEIYYDWSLCQPLTNKQCVMNQENKF